MHFKGIVEEVQAGVSLIHNEHLRSLLQKRDFLVMNTRELTALEFLDLLDQKKAKDSGELAIVYAVPNIFGLVGASLIAGAAGFLPGLLLIPAALGFSRLLHKRTLKDVCSVRQIQLLEHQVNQDYQKIEQAFQALKKAELLERNDGDSYYLTEKGLDLLKRHRAGLLSDISAPSGMQINSTTASNSVSAKSSDKIVRLKRLKCLMSLDPEGTTSGFALLEKTAQAIQQRSIFKRMVGSGIREDQLLKQMAVSDAEWVHQQLDKLASFSLIEKIDKLEKPDKKSATLWKITPSGLALIKEGNPMTNGQVNQTAMQEILQLEIDRLESEKAEKLLQFNDFKKEYDSLESELNEITEEIATTQDKLSEQLEAAQKETEPEQKKKLLRQARQTQLHLERRESRHRIHSQLVERLRVESEAKELWLNKWVEQVETSVSQLIETQMKTRLLQSHQNLQQILDDLHDIETSQLSSKKLLDAEIAALTTHVQDSLEKASPEVLETQVNAERALEDQLLRTLTGEQPDALTKLRLKAEAQPDPTFSLKSSG